MINVLMLCVLNAKMNFVLNALVLDNQLSFMEIIIIEKIVIFFYFCCKKINFLFLAKGTGLFFLDYTLFKIIYNFVLIYFII